MTQVMTTHERERELHAEISGTLATLLPAVDVLAVELLSPERFCVFVDHPNGVDHELCGAVTSALTSYLEEFTVDVSSPGVERPLRASRHFAAALDKRVAIRLANPEDGRRNFRGTITRADETHVELELADGTATIPYEEIARANLIDDGRST